MNKNNVKNMVNKLGVEVSAIIMMVLVCATIVGSVFTVIMVADYMGYEFKAPGVVGIENWEHGHAMCDGLPEKDLEWTNGWDGKPIFYTYVMNGVTYTVNGGHLGDHQARMLVEKAEKHCAQYLK